MTADETRDADTARATLLDLTGVDALLTGADLLPHRRPARLRQAVLNALAVRMCEQNPGLTPPALDAAAEREGISLAFQHRISLAWLTAVGPSLLPFGPLRLRVAVHLALPLLPTPARCQYRGHTHATPCNAVLDAHGHHTHACGHGPRQHKHDRLRAAWQHLMRDAGWHVTPEQLVTTSAGPHRADLVAITPAGLTTAFDIHVTAPLAPTDPAGPQLHRASLAKAARYHTHPDGLLPGNLRFVPLTHCASVPFLHVSALRTLHRLLRDIASRSLHPLALTWGLHFARVTREATSGLAQAFALGSWRQFSACAGHAVG